MRSYHCFYLMKSDEPTPARRFVQVAAADAVSAAQLAMQVTGCAHVTDVVRIAE